MPNPKGGAVGLQVSDDKELGELILSCISDNEAYLVKDPKMIKVIFGLVKAKIKNESLVLTPNMIRFLALKLLNSDSGLIAKIGNVVVSSDNRVRFVTRVVGSAVLGIVSTLFTSFTYGILITLMYFDSTDYFEHLPKDQHQSVRVFAGKDDANQVEIDIPSKISDEVTVSSAQKIKVTKTYKKSGKKLRKLNFLSL